MFEFLKYIAWNNLIGHFLFNRSKAEKEVYLFITKTDIIRIGEEAGIGRGEDVFANYLKAIKFGLPGSNSKGTLLDLAKHSYCKWLERPFRIDGEEVKYPLYINYLALFVLVLTEDVLLTRRAGSYYPKLDKFLKKNNLPSFQKQSALNNWNLLWEDLEHWSIIDQNTELGYLELHPFSNENWVYVGKPLSQCVLTSKAIQALPLFFEAANLVPGDDIDAKDWRELLLSDASDILNLSPTTRNCLQDPSNELGQSVIQVVQKNYLNWEGGTDQYSDEADVAEKGNTVLQLRLCFEGDALNGYTIYYRSYTKLDYPEDLAFSMDEKSILCLPAGSGWSRPLIMPFSEQLELEDSYNKWIARFPQKDIRLFIEGHNFHLSGWVEVTHIIAARMMLMVKSNLAQSIESWGAGFTSGELKPQQLAGLPNGYKLFQLSNPDKSHPEFPSLQFKSDIRITLNGGLKIPGKREWYNTILPKIKVENATGTEKLLMTYDGEDRSFYLERESVSQPVWQLPKDIKLNKSFTIEAEGINTKANRLKNVIRDISSLQGKEGDLPTRDQFGRIVATDALEAFVTGSRLTAEDGYNLELEQRQKPYLHVFKPEIAIHGSSTTSVLYEYEQHNELIINYLSSLGSCDTESYYAAFEQVYRNRFKPEEAEKHGHLSRLKRWSLNYLDYMGLVDYEYSTKKVVVNPSQLILIPTRKGRKALFIGGRSPELVEKLIEAAQRRKFNLSIEAQAQVNKPYLLPATITIAKQDDCKGVEIERSLAEIAEECNMIFEPNKLPQYRLCRFSGSIDEYFRTLVPLDDFKDYGWNTKVFDGDQLKFQAVHPDQIDKNFCLVEYRLNEYTFLHRLWVDGLAYEVNKNWGRFIILEKEGKNVVFFDRDNSSIAVPASLPLPRLLAEAITLCSGKAPEARYLKLGETATVFNIYENIPSFLSDAYFKKIGQKQIETTIPA